MQFSICVSILFFSTYMLIFQNYLSVGMAKFWEKNWPWLGIFIFTKKWAPYLPISFNSFQNLRENLYLCLLTFAVDDDSILVLKAHPSFNTCPDVQSGGLVNQHLLSIWGTVNQGLSVTVVFHHPVHWQFCLGWNLW